MVYDVDFKKTDDGDTTKGGSEKKMIAVSAVSGKPYFETDIFDKFFKLYLPIFAFYYLFDLLVKLYYMNFPSDLFDGCYMGFIVHHVISLFGYKTTIILDHYPWFLMGPVAFHTVVGGFTNLGLFNHIVYSFFVFNWFYGCLRKPVRGKKAYQICCIVSALLVFPLVFIAIGGCMR